MRIKHILCFKKNSLTHLAYRVNGDISHGIRRCNVVFTLERRHKYK